MFSNSPRMGELLEWMEFHLNFTKHWTSCSKQNKECNREMFDVLTFLTKVYEDVEKYGTTDKSCFNTGWLCPVFKGETGP
jgi:hypothetical protein